MKQIILLIGALLVMTEAKSLDFHVKIEEPLLAYVEKALSPLVHQLCPNTEVDFNVSIPHATLYLTDFVNVEAAVKAVNTIYPTLPREPCYFSMGKPVVSGQYFLWNVVVTPCLQHFSDAIVNATYMYHNPDMPIPSWVLNITEPQRSEMIALFKKYGSPGVFSQFNAHITLAWDEKDDLNKLLQLEYPEIVIPVKHFALGVVGPHGTVLRDQDIASWSL